MRVYKDLVRVNGSTPVRLPYPQAKIPINEWIGAEPINAVFQQIYDNYEYIIASSAVYAVAPQFPEYENRNRPVWGQVIENLPGSGNLEWHEAPGGNYSSSSVSPNANAAPITDLWTLNNDQYQHIYIGKTDRVDVYSYNTPGPLLADTSAAVQTETPVRIQSIAADSRDRVYLLDPRQLLVKVYEYSSIQQDYMPIFEWGGLGGVTGNTKFYKPNDMFISNNKVFVVDSGNNCVKRFTLGGQWEYTYTSPSMSGGDIDVNAPITATVDLDNNVYVITLENIIKFDYNGNELFTKPIQMKTAKPMRVRHYLGFMYLATQDNIIRFSASGEATNIFAERDSVSTDINEYTRLTIDTNGHIYVTDGTVILKYSDMPDLLETAPREATLGWTFDQMKVQPDEFVSPLTYNKFFHRMYDNLFILLNNIERKITILPDNSLSVEDLEECDRGGFRPLLLDKSEIYIGLNEFVTPEVMNRCLRQILILQQYLLDMVLNNYSECVVAPTPSVPIPADPLPDCCWSWDARTRNTLCCAVWARLTQTNACTLWTQATSCCVRAP